MQRAIKRRDIPAWVKHIENLPVEQLQAMQDCGQWELVREALGELLRSADKLDKKAAIRLHATLVTAQARLMEAATNMARIETLDQDPGNLGGSVTREMIWREVLTAREKPQVVDTK